MYKFHKLVPIRVVVTTVKDLFWLYWTMSDQRLLLVVKKIWPIPSMPNVVPQFSLIPCVVPELERPRRRRRLLPLPLSLPSFGWVRNWHWDPKEPIVVANMMMMMKQATRWVVRRPMMVVVVGDVYVKETNDQRPSYKKVPWIG